MSHDLDFADAPLPSQLTPETTPALDSSDTELQAAAQHGHGHHGHHGSHHNGHHGNNGGHNGGGNHHGGGHHHPLS
ncbi:MAG TPA: hypothetical protein VFQ80_10805 [Thermomicrobiales bacterium]|nr:hypothetical protein [Thermomicrobiales bacterium]